jgi:curli production assembly/transport component CsgG
MVRYAFLMVCALALAGCTGSKITSSKDLENQVDKAEIITAKRFNELINIPAVNGDPIPVAVYKFSDMSGQRKPTSNYASLSSAVTQGGEVILIKALQDASKGKFFKPIERVSLDNLVKERQLIRSQREVYEKEQAKPLTPLIVAGIMIEGGIVGYDSNIATGGIGARYLGLGAQQEYRKDEVTIMLRLISISTGEILISSGVTKTIYSTGVSANVFKFVDAGTRSVELEAGTSINEPTTYAVRIAIEAAVVDMIKQGSQKKLWKYKETTKKENKK